MELTDTQKQAVTGWVEEGVGLSEIQRRLAGEFDIRVTFMDVRFLMLDLGLKVKEQKTEAPPVPPDDSVADGVPVDGGAADAANGLSSISVEIDRITKPGFLVSGTVRFSDGETASWALDQTGRIALESGTPGYKPSEQDLAAMQEELRRALQSHGF
ncbi:MAG: hypothetical protein HQ559_17345 [Lentisphaerae bacterium]|nr:hypothetical protein [Lentisphaerota bacterium]